MATYDGAVARLYVDGALEGQLTLNQVVHYNSAVPWTIGAAAPYFRARRYPRTWNGLIGDVNLYGRALSAQEVQALSHASPLNGTTSPLTSAKPESGPLG